MEDVLKASAEGLEQVDQARKRKGWNRQSAAWAQIALTSVASLKQFWRRERINRETFVRICQAVGIEDWQAIADSDHQTALPVPPPSISTICDWGEAPEVSFFLGRETELTTLIHWIIDHRAKLVAILGMGGMGKTSLVVRLVEQLIEVRGVDAAAASRRVEKGVRSELPLPNASSVDLWTPDFEWVIWRSLRNAPSLEELVTDLLRFLPKPTLPDSHTQASTTPLNQLLTVLKQQRCLLVLDNVESILAEQKPGVGSYVSGYEGYGELLRRLAEERHQSCLVLTSRELPREMGLLAGERVRSLQLRGLPQAAGQQILEMVGALTISEADCQQIVEHYAGNPLALKITAAGIRDLLQGNVAEFLALLHQGTFLFGDIHDLLERHFERLSHREQEVMFWLAIAREPVSLEEFTTDLLSPESRWKLAETLDALKRRSLLEATPDGFTQQTVIMEFVTRQLTARVCGEIVTHNLTLLRNHALIKATAKDYIRVAQIRLILEPLAEQLQTIYDSPAEIATILAELLATLRHKPALKTGYVAGNVLNLLALLQVDLSHYDFSHLTVWQADLRQVSLINANFAYADLSNSAFTETFSGVLSVAFSPDGKLLAKSDDRGWVSVWQVETGKQLLVFKAHSEWVFSIAFSPDQRAIATASLDCNIKLWDLASGSCLQVLQLHRAGVSAVAFSPTASYQSGILASGSADHTIKLIDLQTWECWHTLAGHQGIVRAIAFSQNGDLLASASLDGTIKLWEIATGHCLQTLENGAAVYTLALAPQEPILASAGEDLAIKLWNLQTGECWQSLEANQEPIWSLAFTADGAHLVSGGDEHLIRIWDPDSGSCLKTLSGHQNRIWAIAPHPHSTIFASGSDDKTVRLWNLEDGQCLRTLQGYHNITNPIAYCSTPNSTAPEKPATHAESTSSCPISCLLTFSADQTIRFWNTQTYQCEKVLCLPTHAAMYAACSPDGQWLATGSLDGSIHLCHGQTGECLRILQGHTIWVRMVAFSPDGTLLISGSGDQTIRVWDVQTGTCLKILTGHTNPINSVIFHPQGKVFASGSWDCSIRLWDMNSGACLRILEGYQDRFGAIAFSPDGQHLLSCKQDGTLDVWNWRTGEFLKHTKLAATEVIAIAYHPKGSLFATASQTGMIQLWCATHHHCLQTFVGQTLSYNTTLIFSPEGEFLVSGGDKGTSSLWDVSTGTCLHSFQIPRPYEGMNITGVTGLTEAQKATLQTLGAVEAGKQI